jgi:hypothetical protein
VWTTTLVRHGSAPRLGLEYGRERVRQLRQALGGGLRRLRHRHLNAKAEAQVAVRTALEESRVEWLEAWERIVVAEATGRRHPTVTAQGGVAAEVPQVPTGDAHPNVPIDGAVAPLTGRAHDHVSPELGQEECATFLPYRVAYDPGKRVLVLKAQPA